MIMKTGHRREKRINKKKHDYLHRLHITYLSGLIYNPSRVENAGGDTGQEKANDRRSQNKQ